MNGCIFRGNNSAIFIVAYVLNGDTGACQNTVKNPEKPKFEVFEFWLFGLLSVFLT